jgi:hypothetical protein
MPSGSDFGIDTLKSSIDLSSIDDVDHFLEKALRATRLPKGYLFGEDTTDRGGALQAQDLKFARALIPVQDAYVNGLTSLCYVLLLHLGANLETVKLSVKLQRPIQLSQEVMQTFTTAFSLVDTVIQTWKNAYANEEGVSPNYPSERIMPLALELGIPPKIAKFMSPPPDDNPPVVPVVGDDTPAPRTPLALPGPQQSPDQSQQQPSGQTTEKESFLELNEAYVRISGLQNIVETYEAKKKDSNGTTKSRSRRRKIELRDDSTPDDRAIK